MIGADRVNRRQYTLTASLQLENIIKENKNIPLFVFKYFSQKNISGLIDETLNWSDFSSYGQDQIKNTSGFSR